MISFMRAVLRTRSSVARRVAEVHLGPAAPRGDGEALAARELHQRADLLDRARLDDEGGLDAVHGVLSGRLADVLRADYVLQVVQGTFSCVVSI